MYGSPARMRVERETARRSNAPVIISTLLSLLVVGVAIAAVAYLVLRAPSSAVDSAERLEPVGTALPAPSEPPTLPTLIPTSEPDPEPEATALGFTGEAPEVSGLPTVAAPRETAPQAQDSGPTPTPRVIALATAAPTEAPLPAPTLPPPVAVDAVPVVALAPVESAPPAPTAAVTESQAVSEPDPEPVEIDDDPFDIFDDGEGSRIAPAQNDALERARELQGRGANDRDGNEDRGNANPVIVPASDNPGGDGRDGPIEVAMPDVDAMIEEITARATDPNRNPNVGNAGRDDPDRDRDDDDVDDRDEDDPRENRRKSARERINERNRGQSSSSRSNRDSVNPNVPVIMPRGSGNDDQECEGPFANLPEDMRPDDFPFNNC